MLKFELLAKQNRPLRILCLGAHCDDIEIGCGGTILRLCDSRAVEFYWVVFSAGEQRELEGSESAKLFLEKAAAKEVIIKNFRNGFFPYIGAEIKEYFEKLKGVYQPDVIFTHYGKDLHQDHRLISELAWNTFRNHWILEYEVPKYDGDFGTPNVFFELDEQTSQRKTSYIMKSFRSQQDKHWFTPDTFLSLMRLRGVESSTKYAEAFYCRKTLF